MTKTIRKDHVIALAVILAVTLCVYGRTIGFEFLATWDDNVYITQNSSVKGFSLPNLKAAFSSFHVGNYAPIQIISYMVDYTVWGLNPAGFHLGNILLHAANGAILFLLMTRLNISILAAAAASIIFLAHPVQVETVAWVSERKNILALLFMLLSLHVWSVWRDQSSGPGKKRLYLLSLVLFLLALLSKASLAIVFPLLLAAYTWSYDNSCGIRKIFTPLLPYLALSVLFCLIALYAQSAEFSGGREEQLKGIWLFTMPPVFAKYIGLILWPHELLPSYLPVYRQNADATVFLSGALLLLCAAAATLLIRAERRLLFWFAFIIVPLLPVSQIIPFVTLMNDRYLYIPMTGVAGLAALWGNRLIHRTTGVKTALVKGGAIGLLLLLAALSFRQTGIWKNDVVLWQYLIQHSAPSALYQWRLGEALRFSGDPGTAMAAYDRALQLSPDYLRGHWGAAEALLQMEKPELAIPHALFIVRKLPQSHLGFTLLGEAYLKLGERSKAESALSRAIQLSPQDSRTVAAWQMLAR